MELCPIEQYDKEGMYTDITEFTSSDWTNHGEKGRQYFDRYATMTAAFSSYINGEENPFTPDYERELYALILTACGK